MSEDVFVIPPSFAQQRLWFLAQLEPEAATYNIPSAVSIEGRLDHVALERSLNEIIRRHEILRTTFGDENGEPWQVIASSLTLPLLLLDLSTLGTAEQAEQVRQLTGAEAHQPFNLAEGPMLRATLLRLKDESHVLLLTMHHIVADGWSVAVLMREMVALYEAFSSGAPSPLPELAIQYADYSLWQREWLQGEVLHNQLSYWKQQLEGVLAPLDLPMSKPRPVALSVHGARRTFTLSKSLTEKLHRLSQREGATLFMTLLAAFETLLYRYAHRDSIIVGSPIAGRNRAEVEDLIGFFVNMLPLRTDISGNPSFTQFLGRVRETALGAYAHQDLPFEMLIDELGLERDINRTPLFHVMFVLQNAPRHTLQSPGLTFRLMDIEIETAKFDLTLTMEQPQEALSGTLSYKTDLFDPAAIELMTRHFENLLESIVAQPDSPVSELSFMAAAERRQLLSEWNDTKADYSNHDCLHRLFEQQARETPDETAVVCGDEKLTYRELNERANQLSRHLQGLGVGPEIPVGILMEKSLDAMTGILGALKAGGYYVPIDHGLPKARLAFILEDTQTPVLLTREGLLESLPECACELVCLDRDWDEIAVQSNEDSEHKVRPENLAYVIYTSGSTGMAKGVAVEHRQLVNYVRAIIGRLGIKEGGSFATVSTLAADLGHTVIYPSLCTGGILHLISQERASDAQELAECFRNHRVGVLKIVPTHLAALMSQPDSRQVLPQEVLVLGGESLSWSLAEKVRAVAPDLALFNHYGPTETTVGVTTYKIEAIVRDDISATVPIGRPLGNTRIYLLDKNDEPVPVGVSGELYIGGDGLTRCYLNRPDSTAEKFIPDPFSAEPGARLYRTGDQARYLPDGNIEFLGRIDQQVKIRGYRIELGEVEAAIGQHPAVGECVVVAREDASHQMLVGYVVAAESEVSDNELREFLRQRLPDYMVPAAIVWMDALPLTPNGKLDRKALPAPQLGGDPTATTAAVPNTPLEELLASIWCQVLNLPQIGVDDNFFELGGHSLLATQVISRVREVFEVEVGVRGLFERPTVRGLRGLIEAERRAGRNESGVAIGKVERGVAPVLSSAQQRLWFLDQLEPNSPFYNLPTAIRLTGRLDVTALEMCLNEIVRRHESLHTTFEVVNGRPSQVIAPSLSIHFDVMNLSDLPEREREAEVKRQVNEEAQQPFNLARGPLMRARLLRLSAEENIALVTMHHIISDGWSIGVLIREIAPLYDAYRRGEAASLPELPIQYADYAAWQEEWLKSDEYAAQVSYWKRQLAGAEKVLELPTDNQRPAVQTYRGARQEFVLPEGLSESIKNLSREEGVTLFMSLLGAFKVMLGKYTQQQDISVGVPIAGRNKVEIENLIGCFMNTLVMRTDLSGNPTFRELLSRVREVTLGAYDHQDLPFEKLVEEVQPQRDLSYSPLFQVMFALNNTRRGVLELDEVKLDALIADSGTAKFDLVLWMDNTGETLKGTLEYNTDLFEHSTMTRMVGHYTALLEGIVADPDQTLSDVRMLTDAERQRLLVDWNDTQGDFAEGSCIHHLIETQAATTPDAVAVIFESEEQTYRQLNERAQRLADYLRTIGVGADVRVGICAERSIEMVVGLLGILKAGGAYVPIDPAYPKERIAFALDDAQVQVLLTQEHLSDSLPMHGAHVVLLEDETGWQRGDGGATGQALPESLAYVIYTSGSTGKPKGVMVSHENVVNFFTAMDGRIGGDSPGTWLALTSISFDISVLELFWTLARGFKVVIQREQGANLVASSLDHATSARKMDFSLFYFASDEDEGAEDKYKLLIEGAKFADRHGFAAIWTPERHFHAFGGIYPNPSVTSAAIATVTERLGIRAGSVVMPLHSPIRVAEEWSVVDNLSRGRVAISFASGWHENDFVLAPDNYAQRKDIMLRNIETVRKLWRGESVMSRGGAGSEVEVKIRPRPVQKELPVWLTAAGNPETFRIAGEIGAGLLTHLLGQSVESLAEKIAIYRETWHKHHPEGGDGHVTLMIHTFVGDDREAVREKVREPFSNYLKSSVDLMRNTARSIGKDVNSQDYNEDDMRAVLAHAFDRYFETSGLFGTPGDCLRMVEHLKSIGVDEVACLIDFGVATESVLSGLHNLDIVRQRSKKRERITDEDFSIPAQIAKHQVTHLQCTPSMAQMLKSDPASRSALRSLHKLMLGGEALPVALANELRAELSADIINMYGPTETTIWSSTFAVEEQSAGRVQIGKPVVNTSMFLLDEQLEPVAVGMPGNLYIGGRGVARGYLKRPQLTAERLIPDPFSRRAGARLYETGDRARYLKDGNIEFLGRNDYQIKIDGHRIELGEIEAVLARIKGVRDAVVMAREDDARGRRLVAYVVPEQASESEGTRQPSPAERERLLAHHRPYRLPNGMVIAHLSDFQTNAGYREVFEDEVYLRHEIILNDGDCIFDVGANAGFFTLFATQKRRDLRVFAFEPIPTTFEVLRTNVALYGLNAKLYECGLSNKAGTAEFTFYPDMAGLSGRYSNAERDKKATRAIIQDWLRTNGADADKAVLTQEELDQLLEERFKSEKYTCQLRTLSEIIRENNVERIGLLKVDVERSEYDVLCGIEEEDWKKIGQIVVEVDTKENLDSITTLLERHNYDVAVDDFVSVAAVGADSEVEVFMLYARNKSAEWQRSSAQSVPPPITERAALSVNGLRGVLKETLPDYMIPSFFVFLDALPLTPNGKLDRNALPEPGTLRPELETSYIAPQTDAERMIVAIWREVLGVERLGAGDNFFEVGGTSLLLVQVNSKLREAFKTNIPMIEMFRHPNVSSMAAYLTQERNDAPSLQRVQERANKQGEAINLQKQFRKARQRIKATEG